MQYTNNIKKLWENARILDPAPMKHPELSSEVRDREIAFWTDYLEVKQQEYFN